MKTFGLIGGISWISTAEYYTLINKGINDKLGGLNFSKCIIYSFNFADIKKNNDANDWDSTFTILSQACDHLQNSGAEAILLCANTMHVIADRIEQHIKVPLIHIATATAGEIEKQNLTKVGLLGTTFTMELDFFKAKLRDKGIETIVPDDEDRAFVNAIIYDELGKGIFRKETKERLISIMNKLVESGAQGIILGCTEIPMIIQQEDVAVFVFDTGLIHANAAVEFSIA